MLKQTILAAALLSVATLSSAVELNNDTVVDLSVLDQLKSAGHEIIGTMEFDNVLLVMLDDIEGPEAVATCASATSIVDEGVEVYLFTYGEDASKCE